MSKSKYSRVRKLVPTLDQRRAENLGRELAKRVYSGAMEGATAIGLFDVYASTHAWPYAINGSREVRLRSAIRDGYAEGLRKLRADD